MNRLGYFLIGLGFFLASLVAVQSESDHVAWRQFLPAWLLGCAGILVVRTQARRRANRAGESGWSEQQLVQSIDRIIERMARLEAEKSSLHPGDFHGKIDQLFREDLSTFADARKSIAHRHGLPAYARMMNEFAAGERYLNRVWSASVDGYVDEVHEYLSRARIQFEQTRSVLQDLSAQQRSKL